MSRSQQKPIQEIGKQLKGKVKIVRCDTQWVNVYYRCGHGFTCNIFTLCKLTSQSIDTIHKQIDRSEACPR